MWKLKSMLTCSITTMVFCYSLSPYLKRNNLSVYTYWCLLYWEHSHFLQGETSNRHHMGCEGCKHMLGGMIRQTCSHTQQTWSFAIFLPTGLLEMNITLLRLLHILTYNTTFYLSKSRYNLGYAAKGFTTDTFLSPVWYHLEGGCGMFYSHRKPLFIISRSDPVNRLK